MMSGKEKIYFLLNRIDDARAITPKGEPVKIHATHDLNNNYRGHELDNIFKKLQDDEQVIKVLKVGNRIQSIIDVELDPYEQIDDGYYHLELLPAFDDYFTEIQEEPEYQKFSGRKPSTKSKKIGKPNRKALEKVWNLLQEIEEKRNLGADGEPVIINQTPYGNEIKDYDKLRDERSSILRKLISLGAIENLEEQVEGALYSWKFQLTERFDDVYDDYQNQYTEAAKDYKTSHETEQENPENPVYKISYSEQTREIVINGFLFKKLRSFSENDAMFAYLYKHSNEDKTDDDIKAAIGYDSIKDLNKFIENIGFKGDYRKVFFKVSKNKIRFNNPITKEYLLEIGVKRLEISS